MGRHDRLNPIVINHPWDLGNLVREEPLKQRKQKLPDGRSSWTLGENVFALLSAQTVDVVLIGIDTANRNKLLARGHHTEPTVVADDLRAGQVVSCALSRYSQLVYEAVLTSQTEALDCQPSVRDLIETSTCQSNSTQIIGIMGHRNGIRIKVMQNDRGDLVERLPTFQLVQRYVSRSFKDEFRHVMDLWRPLSTLTVIVQQNPQPSARELLHRSAIIDELSSRENPASTEQDEKCDPGRSSEIRPERTGFAT